MTQEEYWQKVNFVCENAPKHPLINKLTEAYSQINVMYLRYVLKQLVNRDLDVEPAPRRSALKEKLIDSDDLNLRKLYIKKSSLFTDRAKQSNQFHECRNDDQRAALSDQIQITQKAIEAIMQTIRHYQEFGSLPEDDERYPIPKNPIELARKLNSIRVRISQIKKEIEQIAELPRQHQDRERLPQLEEQLNYYTKYRGHVETAVKQASV